MTDDLKQRATAELRDLLDDLVALVPPPVAPGDVTANMLADATGMKYRTAVNFLDEQRKAGFLEWYDAYDENGHRCKAYRRKAV